MALDAGDDGDKRPETNLNFPPQRAVAAYKVHNLAVSNLDIAPIESMFECM